MEKVIGRSKKEADKRRKEERKEKRRIAYIEAGMEKAKAALDAGATLEEAKELANKAAEGTIKNRDEEYVQAVNEFTHGFRFLKQFPEAAGERVKNKFTDKEFAEKYFELRKYLQERRQDEFITIQEILEKGKINGKKIDDATRVILEKRLEKMQQIKKGELYNSYSR